MASQPRGEPSRMEPMGRLDESEGDPFDHGPFSRLQSLFHLPPVDADPRMRWRRGLVLAGLAWIPLLVLSALEGTALGPGPDQSFLLDISAHVRYLAAIPILVAAESWCLPRLAAIARNFASGGLVAWEDRPRLETLRAAARGRLDQRGLEVVLAVIVYATSVLTAGLLYPRTVSSWVSPGAGEALSLAGWWRTLVSHPVFLLVVMAWLWRVLVWALFLWGVSRLKLRLVASHPDLAAGLRFVSGSLGAFAPLGLAIGVVVAGGVAEDILFGAHPGEFRHGGDIALALGTVFFLFAGPLLVFTGPLRRARLRGVLEYGALADALGRRFEERWLRAGRPLTSEALDAQDFSATTDLYSVVANVRRISMAPVGLQDLSRLAVVTLAPFAPLALLVVPVNELLGRLAGLLL